MPIYEYQCQACGHVLDALQKHDDAPLKKCPDCGKPKLKRLLSAPMFLLKGSGWYETDFKSDKERRKNLADRAEPEKKDEAAKGGDAKAQTPPAAEAAADTRKADKGDGAAEKSKTSTGRSARKPAARTSRKPKARPGARRPRA